MRKVINRDTVSGPRTRAVGIIPHDLFTIRGRREGVGGGGVRRYKGVILPVVFTGLATGWRARTCVETHSASAI